MSDAVELHLRPHCVLNTRIRAQWGKGAGGACSDPTEPEGETAAARWAALSAESTKPAGATAGSNPSLLSFFHPFVTFFIFFRLIL